jgi:hypothetical protein
MLKKPNTATLAGMVSQLTADCPLTVISIARETLLNLRLTSREFADLAIVNAVLFEKLEFQATKDSLTRLKQTNVASLAPFVKELSFLPTFYFATLGYSDFQRLHLNIADHPQPLENHRQSAVRKFVEEYRNGESHRVVPVTHDKNEMSDAYEDYIDRANLDLDLMVNGSFHDVWLKCFQSFQMLTSIHLYTALLVHPFIPPWPCTAVIEHIETYDRCDKCIESFKILSQDFGLTGHLVFRTVVGCMVVANTQIQILAIDWELLITLGEEWQSPGWQLLSLDHLAKLVVRHADDALHFEERNGVSSRVNRETSVKTLLDKTHATLQHLKVTYQVFGSLDWPSMSSIGFPCLRHLDIEGVRIDLDLFAVDISHLRMLEQIDLANIGIVQREGHWKPVFDALREHQPRLKHISFDEIDHESGFNWSTRVTEDELRGADPGEESWSYPHPLGNSLWRYLTKRGNWDDALKAWFSDDWVAFYKAWYKARFPEDRDTGFVTTT